MVQGRQWILYLCYNLFLGSDCLEIAWLKLLLKNDWMFILWERSYMHINNFLPKLRNNFEANSNSDYERFFFLSLRCIFKIDKIKFQNESTSKSNVKFPNSSSRRLEFSRIFHGKTSVKVIIIISSKSDIHMKLSKLLHCFAL